MKGWPREPQMAYDELMAQDAAAAADGAPITQVIFDFGNVLLYWDPEAVMIPRYSQRLVDGVPRQRCLILLRCERPDGCGRLA